MCKTNPIDSVCEDTEHGANHSPVGGLEVVSVEQPLARLARPGGVSW